MSMAGRCVYPVPSLVTVTESIAPPLTVKVAANPDPNAPCTLGDALSVPPAVHPEPPAVIVTSVIAPG